MNRQLEILVFIALQIVIYLTAALLDTWNPLHYGLLTWALIFLVDGGLIYIYRITLKED